MTPKTLPAIPEIEDPNLRDAVSALCRTAAVFHRCFTATLDGTPPMDLIREHRDLLLETEQVLQAWRDHLGHTVDDLLDES